MLGKNRKWLLAILPIMVFGLLLAACAPDNNAENAFGTPGVEEDFGAEEGGEVIGGEEEDPLAPATEPVGEEEVTEEEVTEEPIEEEVTEEPIEEEVTEESAEDDDLATFTEATTQWVSSERLLGLPVYTQDGEEIADVNEVLMDEQGQITHVIFDATDFLELDEDHTVAVPWNGLTVQALADTDDGLLDMDDDTDDTDDAEDTAETPEAGDDADAADDTAAQDEDQDLALVYAGSAAQLEVEQRINTDVLDEDGIYVDFNQLTTIEVEDDDTLDDADEEDMGEDAEAEETEMPEEGDDAAAMTGNRMLQLSELNNYNLINENDEDLASIDRFVIDTQQGAVRYAIADVGGFLGIGANSIAIPWDRLQIDEEQEVFVLPADQQTLEEAPTLDDGFLDDDVFDEGWNEDFDVYWQGVS